MELNTYLLFDGQCETAFKLYEKVFGGKIQALIPYEGTPGTDQIPAAWRTKIMHANLIVDGQSLMGSDAPPDRYRKPQGFSAALAVKEPDEAERIFNALAENGKVVMPIGKTFWATRFGMLADRFGIPWMINCMKPA